MKMKHIPFILILLVVKICAAQIQESNLVGTWELKKTESDVEISETDISDEDRLYIELAMPPKLDLSISKKSKVRVFPDSLSDLPRSAYHDFSAVIKQTSSQSYNHELIAEFFVIGREKIGDKHILLDYQKASFQLNEGSRSVFELPGNTVELMQFEMNGQLMGQEYAGYIILVTDARGVIIAQEAQRDEWLNIVDNLRKLPIMKYFDDDGNRCFATRPKRWY